MAYLTSYFFLKKNLKFPCRFIDKSGARWCIALLLNNFWIYFDDLPIPTIVQILIMSIASCSVSLSSARRISHYLLTTFWHS